MNRNILIAVVVLVVAIALMFGYSYYQEQRLSENADVQEEQMEEEEQDLVRVNGVHVFRDGTHTILGEVPMPTACHLVEADAVVAESAPEQVMIELSTVNNAGEDEMCAQVITPQRFQVQFDASAEAEIRGVLDGNEVILNLVEGDPNQDLEELDMFYFKG